MRHHLAGLLASGARRAAALAYQRTHTLAIRLSWPRVTRAAQASRARGRTPSGSKAGRISNILRHQAIARSWYRWCHPPLRVLHVGAQVPSLQQASCRHPAAYPPGRRGDSCQGTRQATTTARYNILLHKGHDGLLDSRRARARASARLSSCSLLATELVFATRTSSQQ